MSLFNTLIPALTRTPVRQDYSPAADLGQTLKPAYEVKESAEAYSLVAYLPGVTKDGLELTAENGQVTVIGRRAWKQPEGWTSLYRESADATFYLVLTHENALDADKIVAELNDGVLRVSLPKSEAVKPRKIAVN
jgi:HSP20 family protein